MKRPKIAKEGAEVFRKDPKGGERPPAFPVRVGGVVLKCRGDGPAPFGPPRRDLTEDEYCGRPRPGQPGTDPEAASGVARAQ